MVILNNTYCQQEKICYYFTIIILHREKVLSSDNLICQNKVLFSTNLIEKSEFKICSYCSVYLWITMPWLTYCQGITWKTSEKKSLSELQDIYKIVCTQLHSLKKIIVSYAYVCFFNNVSTFEESKSWMDLKLHKPSL